MSQDRDYYGIRKVRWDQLWHALYHDRFNRDLYDRVTVEEALGLLPTLCL